MTDIAKLCALCFFFPRVVALPLCELLLAELCALKSCSYIHVIIVESVSTVEGILVCVSHLKGIVIRSIRIRYSISESVFLPNSSSISEKLGLPSDAVP